MPIYEYECLKCGKRTEALQRFGDPPPKKCPSCGGKLKKMVSAPAFQFKGTGFYATDYAGKKGGVEASGHSGAGEKAESSEKAERGDPSDGPKKSGKGHPSDQGGAAASEESVGKPVKIEPSSKGDKKPGGSAEKTKSASKPS